VANLGQTLLLLKRNEEEKTEAYKSKGLPYRPFSHAGIRIRREREVEMVTFSQ